MTKENLICIGVGFLAACILFGTVHLCRALAARRRVRAARAGLFRGCILTR